MVCRHTTARTVSRLAGRSDVLPNRVPVQVWYTVKRTRNTPFGDRPLPAGTVQIYEADSAGRLEEVRFLAEHSPFGSLEPGRLRQVAGRAQIEFYTEGSVILREGENYVLKDLGSENGTWVGGRRARAEAKLHHNECIVAGRTLFLFREQPIAPAMSPCCGGR